MYRNKHKLSLNLPIHPDSVEELGITFMESEKIVPIKQGKLCLPNDRTNIAFVQKKGKKNNPSEITIYKLIASNKQSKKKLSYNQFLILVTSPHYSCHSCQGEI